jgi:hypothetical protein
MLAFLVSPLQGGGPHYSRDSVSTSGTENTRNNIECFEVAMPVQGYQRLVDDAVEKGAKVLTGLHSVSSASAVGHNKVEPSDGWASGRR